MSQKSKASLIDKPFPKPKGDVSLIFNLKKKKDTI
jgi:hypothetical protein